ncbi:MAG: hypothetical protein KGL39_41095 [Patescibacteria group bacterium]|nr:hypothetical protein [Patescibacteria group bacterium]
MVLSKRCSECNLPARSHNRVKDQARLDALGKIAKISSKGKKRPEPEFDGELEQKMLEVIRKGYGK